MIHSPENLVLDEPTDGLDPDQKREIRSLIEDLKETTAIIVSTHILEEIGAVCDHVLAIRRGRAVFNGSATEFRGLSPDEGAVVLTTEANADLSVFNFFKDAASFSITKKDGVTSIKLRPAPGKEKTLAASAMNFAAAQKINILECDILHADLSDVFALLGNNEGDETC